MSGEALKLQNLEADNLLFLLIFLTMLQAAQFFEKSKETRCGIEYATGSLFPL